MDLFEEGKNQVCQLRERIRRGECPIVTAVLIEHNKLEGRYFVVNWEPSIPMDAVSMKNWKIQLKVFEPYSEQMRKSWTIWKSGGG